MSPKSPTNYEATVVLLLEQIKDLRIELKTDLTNIHKAIGEQVSDLVKMQREYASENNKIYLDYIKLDVRVKMLENFKYVLLAAVLLGCVIGTSIAPYLPTIAKLLLI